MPEALPSPRILEHLDAPRGLLLSFPFAGREAAAPGQSRWEASDRSRELLCECHEHLGRDADFPALRGVQGPPAAVARWRNHGLARRGTGPAFEPAHVRAARAARRSPDAKPVI
jgi:hypothetical protein